MAVLIQRSFSCYRNLRICFLKIYDNLFFNISSTFFLTNLHKNHFIVSRSSLTQAKQSIYNIVYILMVSWIGKILRLKAVRFLCNFVCILCRYEPGETIATKIENILLKTDSYLKENQLTLNADKTELVYFSTRDELEPKVTLNGNLIKSADSCRYLGIHLDSKLTFEAHLNVVLKKWRPPFAHYI